MKKSLLQLENYTFTKISVDCEFRDEWPASLEVLVEDIEFDLNLHSEPVQSEQKKVIVRLLINNKESESGKGYYRFKLEALASIGFSESFQDHPSSQFSEEMKEKMLVINGANILYGLMRDRLSSLTSSMVWGGVVLPLVTFDGLAPLKAKNGSLPIKPVARTKRKGSKKA